MLYIAGINHNDPLGREALQKWLNELASKYTNTPEFIAVEWPEEVFVQVVSQRTILRRRAEETWPAATTHFLDTVTASMGFEGDTHLEVFPNVRILWLDEDREVAPSLIENYAVDRLNIYQDFLPPNNACMDGEALFTMSNEAWVRVEGAEKGGPRDAKFAQLLINACSSVKCSWAVVIVGASHADAQQNDCMVSLLVEAGVQCDVSILRPKVP